MIVLVLEFLDSLDEKWEHHVDALKNNEKINTMDLQIRFGNLRNHKESNIQRKEIVKENIKGRSFALFYKKSLFPRTVTSITQ